MAETMVLKVSKDFSRTPGGREHALELTELMRQYLVSGPLLVDLDGAAGYASSFLDEAFGGLTLYFTEEYLRANLTFRSEKEPYLIDEIWGDISEWATLGANEVSDMYLRGLTRKRE